MKKYHFIILSLVLIAGISVFSCAKDSAYNFVQQSPIDRLKAVTDSVITNTQVPGIVALVVDHKQGINWMYTAGLSDISNKLPMDSNFTFRIASCSKTFVGTVLLQLVDEGKLTLADKLSKFFPDYPKADSITIAMLGNMTSGVFDFFADPQFINSYSSNPLKVYSSLELANLGFSNPFSFAPGNGWAYSNTGSVVLGLLIEKVTGKTLEAEINDRIIVPMQLSHTGCKRTGIDFPGPHARGYYFPDINNYGDMTTPFDISRAWAAGNIYSKPRDLQRFVEKLVEGGFLSDSLQSRRLSDMHYVGGLFGSYGLCLLKHGSFYGHGGTLWGFTSVMFHSIQRHCTIIIYFNCDLETTYHPLNLFLRYVNILYGTVY